MNTGCVTEALCNGLRGPQRRTPPLCPSRAKPRPTTRSHDNYPRSSPGAAPPFAFAAPTRQHCEKARDENSAGRGCCCPRREQIDAAAAGAAKAEHKEATGNSGTAARFLGTHKTRLATVDISLPSCSMHYGVWGANLPHELADSVGVVPVHKLLNLMRLAPVAYTCI